MKIAKQRLKEIILEEVKNVLNEAELVYRSSSIPMPNPKEKPEPDHLPHWNVMNKALNLIFEELALIIHSSKKTQRDTDLVNLIRLIKTFVEKNPQYKMTEIIYKHTQDQWENLSRLGKHIKNKIPRYVKYNYPSQYDKIDRLATFINKIAALRAASMSLGFPLKDQGKDIEIPPEIA